MRTADLPALAAPTAPAAANGLDPRVLLAGPLWAAARGRWLAFAGAAALELLGLVLALAGLLGSAGPPPWRAFAGVALVAVGRLGIALLARRGDDGRARRQGEGSPTAAAARRRLAGAAILAFAYGLTLYRVAAPAPSGSLVRFPAPEGLDRSVAALIDLAVAWMRTNWVAFFDAITAALRAFLDGVETVFVGTPWPVVLLAAVLAAWRLSGRRAALFAAACLAYLGLFGFWEKGMQTLALVATAVAICVAAGLPLGIACAKSRRLRAVVEPVLDVMQTLPTFVYLIPAVAFFSIGKPPGVIATVIFALAPMVRLTALGIRQVPPAVREAADAFGATPWQLLVKVELPLAVGAIRLGVNQTIMMSLSMVVVAALIGAGGLGLDVMRSLQHLKTGQGFLAGIAIVLCAMALDRMVRGEAAARERG